MLPTSSFKALILVALLTSNASAQAVEPEASLDRWDVKPSTPFQVAPVPAPTVLEAERKTVGGALKTALSGAAAGAMLGFGMEVIDPDGEIADVWPTLLAVPGFFGGLVYYLVR